MGGQGQGSLIVNGEGWIVVPSRKGKFGEKL